MASNTETGNAKNVGNYKLLIETVTGFNSTYNPSNPLLLVTAMQTQYNDAKTKQTAVNTKRGTFDPLVNARQDVFEPVKKLVRRIVSFAKSCGATKNFVEDVQSRAKKILGERAGKGKPTEKDPAGTSASQQGFDNTVDNFEALVTLLGSEPKYAPNEAELAVAGLTAKLGDMTESNDAVKAGAQPLNTAIRDRNRALYTVDTGVVDVAQTCKNYVRSAFGFSSPEFKLVSKIQFKKMVVVTAAPAPPPLT